MVCRPDCISIRTEKVNGLQKRLTKAISRAIITKAIIKIDAPMTKSLTTMANGLQSMARIRIPMAKLLPPTLRIQTIMAIFLFTMPNVLTNMSRILTGVSNTLLTEG